MDSTLKKSFLQQNGSCLHVMSLPVKMVKEKPLLDFSGAAAVSPVPVLLLSTPKTMSREKWQPSHEQVPNSPTARWGGIASYSAWGGCFGGLRSQLVRPRLFQEASIVLVGPLAGHPHPNGSFLCFHKGPYCKKKGRRVQTS